MEQPTMEKYMSIDEFLEKYYSLFDMRHPWGTTFIWSEISEGPQGFFQWYDRNKENIKDKTLQSLYAEIAKAMRSQSAAAQDFLYSIQVATAFDNWNAGKDVPIDKLQQYAKTIRYAISKGTIKNPSNGYHLLEHIVWKMGKNDQELLRELAMHPLSTPEDVRQWLSLFLNGPYYINPRYKYKENGPQFTGSINDVKKKLNDLVARAKLQISEELNKTKPNEDTIRSFGTGYISDVAHQIAAIVEHLAQQSRLELRAGQTMDDVAKAKNIAKSVDQEFDWQKMMQPENGNYVQQYADQAELTLAEIAPKYEQLQQEHRTTKTDAAAREERLRKELENERKKAKMYQAMYTTANNRTNELAEAIQALQTEMDAALAEIQSTGRMQFGHFDKMQAAVLKLSGKFGKVKEDEKRQKEAYDQSINQYRNNFLQNGGVLEM